MTIDFERSEMTTVQDIIAADGGPQPPAPLRETAQRSLGLNNVRAERYTSREWFDLEMRYLWPKVWQWACREEDIPRVGDHVVYDIGRYSILVVRSGPGEIRAYHNSCLHRGTQLKSGRGNSDSIMCPFHGWSWNLRGDLERVPCRWDFPQVRDQDFHLPEVQVATWQGFVMINMDPGAPPLEEHLDVLPQHFEHYPLTERRTVAHFSKVIPCNWKSTMEAFLESYHVIATHPDQLEWNGDANTQYDCWDTVSRLYTCSGTASPHMGPDYDPDAIWEAVMSFFAPAMGEHEVPARPDGAQPRKALIEWLRAKYRAMGLDLSANSGTEILDAVQYFVFPNWCPWAGVVNGIQYRFRPNGTDHTTSLMDVRLLAPLSDATRDLPPAEVVHLGIDEPFSDAPGIGALARIFEQDAANLPKIQRGLEATATGQVVLGDYQESRIRHFHHILGNWIPSPETGDRKLSTTPED